MNTKFDVKKLNEKIHYNEEEYNGGKRELGRGYKIISLPQNLS